MDALTLPGFGSLSRIHAEERTTKYTKHTKRKAMKRFVQGRYWSLNGGWNLESVVWVQPPARLPFPFVYFVYFVYFVVATEWLRLSQRSSW